jgi:hypothetical protein
MQRRERTRRLQLAENLIINKAVAPEPWSTVHDPMPDGDRRRHLGVVQKPDHSNDRFPLTRKGLDLGQQRLLRETRAVNLPCLSPVDSASPESRSSIRVASTRYTPNLSEDEPLFSARIVNSGSAPVISHRVERSNSQVPTPIADLRHVVTMLADIEFVTLHHGPIALARLLHLIDETRNAPDGVKGKLVAVEIV